MHGREAPSTCERTLKRRLHKVGYQTALPPIPPEGNDIRERGDKFLQALLLHACSATTPFSLRSSVLVDLLAELPRARVRRRARHHRAGTGKRFIAGFMARNRDTIDFGKSSRVPSAGERIRIYIFGHNENRTFPSRRKRRTTTTFDAFQSKLQQLLFFIVAVCSRCSESPVSSSRARANNNDSEAASRDRLRQRGGGSGGGGDASKLTAVSISRPVLYFLGVSYRSSGCNEFISTPPPRAPIRPPSPAVPLFSRSTPAPRRTYLCLCVYMYVLTFRLRDFFIFAQSAYPSPFASEDAPRSSTTLSSPRIPAPSHFSLFSGGAFSVRATTI